MRVFCPRESLDSTPRSKAPSRNALRCLLGLALVLGLFSGCGSKDNDDGWYTLVLVPAAGTDPFADPDAEFLYLRIEDRDLDLIAERAFPLDDGEFVLGD